MGWYLNLSTKIKLILGFGLVLVMGAIMVFNTQNQLGVMWGNQKMQYEVDHRIITSILRINIDINGIRASGLNLINLKSKEELAPWKADVEFRVKRMKSYNDTINSVIQRSGNQNFILKTRDFQALLEEYLNTVNGQLLPGIESGKIKDVRDLVYGVQLERYKRIKQQVNEMQDMADAKMRKLIKESELSYNRASNISIAIGLFALLLSIVIVVVLNRIIAVPLKEYAEITGKIASGDLTVKVKENENRDEFGAFSASFTKMICTLRAMLQDIYETVNVLSSASVQISAGSSQLAASSNETAASVSETTATVEEIRQTTSVANQKARQVAEGSQRASEISAEGKIATEETIDGINKIGGQMESIADSIIRLSDQSRAISEIISTVNDLAEQTNLLAVNASIEAARAGEQGKGFVVVAQEMKSLADQSKQSTMQVRTILNDIQNAISAAVMATEQGSKIVEKSISQSTRTSSSIQSIEESIGEAAQLSVQISVSSQEQTIGMDQVALAMENIKIASTQNAQTSKQLEASVHDLKRMGEKLREIIAGYKL